jgi:hypothetical protein
MKEVNPYAIPAATSERRCSYCCSKCRAHARAALEAAVILMGFVCPFIGPVGFVFASYYCGWPAQWTGLGGSLLMMLGLLLYLWWLDRALQKFR